MSKFESRIMAVESSTDHPNADRLSIVKLKGYDYRIVSAKLEDGSHRYKKNDWVIYVQADSIVPEYLLRQGFWDEAKGTGILAGKNGDRVKPIKLRGITSEGIMFGHPIISQVDYFEMDCIVTDAEGNSACFCLGEDVSEWLGIVKYEPVLPASMAGDLLYIGQDKIGHYDIENAKKFPGVLNATGREIYLTEKLHGTFCGVGYIHGFKHPELFTLPDHDGSFIVFSKGLGAKGLVFKNNIANKNNLYVRTVLENKLFEKLSSMILDISIFFESQEKDEKYYVFGEIFGKGVQDLHYGLDKPQFRAFDVKFGGEYLNANGKYDFLEHAGFATVPVLAVVEKEDEILPYIDGRTSLGEGNIREGVVATPSHEGRHPELGRIILKYVSEDYLNRKGETTEYQ